MLYCVLVVLCFFFKQKTAYEMRISDWSSDVCSSDLPAADEGTGIGARRLRDRTRHADQLRRIRRPGFRTGVRGDHRALRAGRYRQPPRQFPSARLGRVAPALLGLPDPGDLLRQVRSEEHTSELQSLMRISYAVFCLKKNKH